VTALVAGVALMSGDVSRAINSCSSTTAFAIGEEFVVFASAAGEVLVGHCTPTRRLDPNRRLFLADLRELKNAAPRPT
jgi:hypothetical protein